MYLILPTAATNRNELAARRPLKERSGRWQDLWFPCNLWRGRYTKKHIRTCQVTLHLPCTSAAWFRVPVTSALSLSLQLGGHATNQERQGRKQWREGGRWEGRGRKEARVRSTLTLTANKFDTIVTYLFIEEYALALYFGLRSLANKYKMENVQLDKKFFKFNSRARSEALRTLV